MRQPESVPLKERDYNVYNPDAEQAAMAQHTIVNVVQEMPKDHIVWSLFNLLYGNIFCLGLFALLYSVKARDKKVVGDIESARSYGSTARTLNIISTVILCISVFICITVIAVTLSQAFSYSRHYYG